jgi:hypothetical protein
MYVFENIDSKVLDKSSDIVATLDQTPDYDAVSLTLSLEIYTYILRFLHLNMNFTDNYRHHFDFSHVNEIFQSTEHICYLNFKLKIKHFLKFNFEQDNREFA